VEKKLIAAKVQGDAKLMASFRQGFVNRYWWDHFRVKVHRLKLPAIERSSTSSSPSSPSAGAPGRTKAERRIHRITSGGLERRMEPIGRWLEPRAPLLTNKARLDRMLMLMQLQLDGLADEAAYADHPRLAQQPPRHRRAAPRHRRCHRRAEPPRRHPPEAVGRAPGLQRSNEQRLTVTSPTGVLEPAAAPEPFGTFGHRDEGGLQDAPAVSA